MIDFYRLFKGVSTRQLISLRISYQIQFLSLCYIKLSELNMHTKFQTNRHSNKDSVIKTLKKGIYKTVSTRLLTLTLHQYNSVLYK